MYTVTRMNVAEMRVPPFVLLFCAFAMSTSWLWSSFTLPLFSAASTAFMVGRPVAAEPEIPIVQHDDGAAPYTATKYPAVVATRPTGTANQHSGRFAEANITAAANTSEASSETVNGDVDAFAQRVISRTRCLARSGAFGATTRVTSEPVTELGS